MTEQRNDRLAAGLRRQAQRLMDAELKVIALRKAMHAAIVAKALDGLPQNRIVEETNYGRERVRTICREGGVEPAKPGRPPKSRELGA